MRLLLSIALLAASSNALADCMTETRPIQPKEREFFEARIAELKKALPAPPKGWAFDGEPSSSIPDEICAAAELEKGTQPMSTSIEVKYAQVEGVEAISAKMQAVMEKFASGKATDADTKEMQRLGRSVRASVRLQMNPLYLQSSCDDVTEIAVPGAVKAWRECTPATNGGDTSAWTKATFGRTKNEPQISGKIHDAWDKDPKASYLSVTDLMIEIQAEPETADALMKQMAPAVAKLAPAKSRK